MQRAVDAGDRDRAAVPELHADVGGKATLGGTLELVTDAGVYGKGEQFDFLYAGSIAGSFGTRSATNGLPFSVSQAGADEIATLLAGNFAATGGSPNEDRVLTADVKVAWAHDFNGVTPTIAESFPVTPGASFVLAGANTGQDAAVLSGGLSLAASRRLSVFARYDATLSNRDTNQMVDLGLKFRW